MAFPNNLKPVADRGAGLVRSAGRGLGRLGRMVGSEAYGLLQKARNARPAPKTGMTDASLKSKVESIVFRPEGVPKGQINVTVVDGRVTLHGEIKRPEQITALISAVEAIPEVESVENMLHLPKTPAASRTGATRKKPAATRTTGGGSKKPGRFNREVTTAAGEPSPTDLAATSTGRKPAPLGSKDPDTEDGAA